MDAIGSQVLWLTTMNEDSSVPITAPYTSSVDLVQLLHGTSVGDRSLVLVFVI
jgi:hypothetical protein